MHKNAIWDRTPPTTHQLQSTFVREGQGSQIFKWNSIISIHSKVMAFLVISLSPWSPHRPHHPHIIPIAPRRFPCGPHGCGLPWSPPHVVPVVPLIPMSPRHPHIIPVVPMSSPHHLEGPHVIPNPPDTHCTHPHPPGGGGPKLVKMQ